MATPRAIGPDARSVVGARAVPRRGAPTATATIAAAAATPMIGATIRVRRHAGASVTRRAQTASSSRHCQQSLR
jgi:hypothetical protein